MKSRILGHHLNGHKDMSLNCPIEDFLNPQFVYFPIALDGSTFTQLKKVGDDVLMGEPILIKEGRFAYPILSSVSGKIVGVTKQWHSSGKMVEMWEIENDGKETPFYNDVPSISKREDAIEHIKKYGIIGLGGAGFPTYVKYLPTDAAKVVIINAAECEPYITCDYLSIINRAKDLIKGLKFVMDLNDCKKGVIAIKKSKFVAIEALYEAIGDDKSIEVFLLKDTYPAGWEKFIVEHVTKSTYVNLPREAGAIVNNVQTILAIFDAVFNNKPLIERVVTITGDGLKEPKNFRIKIGTKVNELINRCGGYVEDLTDGYFIAGGPMTGHAILFDELVLTSTVGSVIVKKKNPNSRQLNCIGCGKCAERCPVFLTPTSIRQAYLSKNVDELVKLRASKCVQCGLCSYVCPSRVEMTDFMFKAKDMVLKANALKK